MIRENTSDIFLADMAQFDRDLKTHHGRLNQFARQLEHSREAIEVSIRLHYGKGK